MGIEWNVDPVLFSLFNTISIRYYSLFFMLGLALGYKVITDLWRHDGLPIKELDKLAVYIFFATIIGARLGHCLLYEPEYFLSHPLEMILPFGVVDGKFSFTGYQGLASHGGILAVVLVVYFFSKRSRTSFFSIADKVSIGGAITAVFIRLGNFMNSEIIGTATNRDFGVVFQRVDDILRHPSQLYEACAYLIIFLIIRRVYKQRKNRQDGFVFGLFFTLLFISRFFIEFTKIDQVAFEAGKPYNMGQLLSIPFIILGLVFVISRSRSKTSVKN